MTDQIQRSVVRLGACMLAFALGACSEPQTADSVPRPVRVTQVQFQQTSTTARYSGEVKARYESPLAFQVNGKIVQRLVDVGTVVQRGRLLATLDPADYRLDQAGSAAQLAEAQAQLSLARKDLLHLGNLLEQDLSSPVTFERRKDQVRAAEARVSEAQARLAMNARKSAYTELRAEQDGVITAVEGEVGQVVPAGQSLFHLARTEEKEVVINVPENRLQALRTASDVKVSLWASPGVLYEGRLREISPGVDAVIRTYTVKVSILEADQNVGMGMTATVHVQKAEPKPVAWLPLTAITQDQAKASVWVVDAETATVQPRPVTVASYEDENAKIVEGVQAGERVVSAGVHKLLPGQKVRILGDEPP